LAAFAKGLRKSFNPIARKELGTLLLKLKEKKQITDEVFLALDAFDYCYKLEEVLEDIKVGLKEKNTVGKTNTIDWVIKSLKKDREQTEKIADKLIGMIVELTDDADKGVRESSMKLFGYFISQVGEEKFSKFFSKMTGPKQKTIMKFSADYQDGEEKQSPPPKGKQAAVPERASVIVKPPTKMEGQDNPKAADVKPKKLLKQGTMDESRIDDSTTQKAGRGTVKASIVPVIENPKLSEPNMNYDDACAKLESLEFESSIIESLNNNQWEQKNKGLLRAFEWLADNLNYSEEIMIILRHTTKGFTFSNPNFNKEIFSSIMEASEAIEFKKQLFCEPNVRLMVEFCIERFNDKNFLSKIINLMVRACSTVNPKAIISTLIELVKKKTFNAKLSESLNDFLAKMITTLTTNYLPITDLIDFSKYTFDQKNGSIRKIGTTIICQLYSMIGNKVKDFLTDINQNVMKSIDAELKKITVNTKIIPTIEIFGAKPADLKIMEPNQAIPQFDIGSSLISLIPNLDHTNYQNRKEALESGLELLGKALYNIKPVGLENFIQIAAKRIEDSHKTVMKLGLEFAGDLAKSLGKSFKPHLKLFSTALIKNLTDKQAQVREEALKSITKIYENVDEEHIINALLASLASENSELKQECLNFLNSHEEGLYAADIKSAIEPTLKGLESKIKPLKDSFEQFLKISINAKGEDIYLKPAKSMGPATVKTLQYFLDKFAGKEVAQDFDRTAQKGEKLREREDTKRSITPNKSKTIEKPGTTIFIPDPIKETLDAHTNSIPGAIPQFAALNEKDKVNSILSVHLYNRRTQTKGRRVVLGGDWTHRQKPC
jgi:hypothetical protein